MQNITMAFKLSIEHLGVDHNNDIYALITMRVSSAIFSIYRLCYQEGDKVEPDGSFKKVVGGRPKYIAKKGHQVPSSIYLKSEDSESTHYLCLEGAPADWLMDIFGVLQEAFLAKVSAEGNNERIKAVAQKFAKIDPSLIPRDLQ